MVDERYVIAPGARGTLVDLGVSPANVLRRAQLPADLLARTPLTMRPDEYYAFWQALEDETGDPALPVTVARAVRAEAFQVPTFAALCSPNLGVAVERIAAHKRLVGPLRLEVEDHEDGLAVRPVWPAHHDPPTVLVHIELLFWVALARIGTHADVRPQRVTSPAPPATADPYQGYLGTPITRAAHASIRFTRLDARRPFLTADDRMWEFFAPELRRRLSELDQEASTTARVRAALHELLPSGDPAMTTMARRLAMSTRTLQRRLRDEDTTYQEVLAGTREALARHYLTSSRVPAAEIAFLLGYEDTNSFYRAFQQWTGQTPQGVRETAAT